MMVKKRESTWEWWTRLQADPEFIARRREKDRIFEESAARWRAEEEPILAELHEVGLDVKSTWDLINTSTRHEEAIPILLKHLQLPHSDRIREGIARALAVPEARYAWPTLIAEFKNAPMGVENGILLCAKDGLAVALAATATDAVIEELIALAKDRSHGNYRLLLLSALRKSKNPLARQALDQLASDPDLADEIASWKKKKRK
jgi:hypothetical protein